MCCCPGVEATEERSSSLLPLKSGFDNELASDWSHWPLSISSLLHGARGDDGNGLQTTMMSGTGWADGPDLLIFIADKLLVIVGIEWEEVQETESAKVIAAMAASRYLLTSCRAWSSLSILVKILFICGRT